MKSPVGQKSTCEYCGAPTVVGADGLEAYDTGQKPTQSEKGTLTELVERLEAYFGLKHGKLEGDLVPFLTPTNVVAFRIRVYQKLGGNWVVGGVEHTQGGGEEWKKLMEFND